MTSNQLPPSQAHSIRDRIAPTLAYLGRLRDRMVDVGFPPQDPLYLLTCEARNGLHGLFVEAHYAGCTSGVGRGGALDTDSPVASVDDFWINYRLT